MLSDMRKEHNLFDGPQALSVCLSVCLWSLAVKMKRVRSIGGVSLVLVLVLTGESLWKTCPFATSSAHIPHVLARYQTRAFAEGSWRITTIAITGPNAHCWHLGCSSAIKRREGELPLLVSSPRSSKLSPANIMRVTCHDSCQLQPTSGRARPPAS
jgi:hypothetical protein